MDWFADPVPPMCQANILDEINDPGFVPKRFISSKSAVNQVSDTLVIDLTVDAAPPVVQATEDPESIFHTSVSIVTKSFIQADFISLVKRAQNPWQKSRNAFTVS
jgi:hypothetical protein